MKKRNHSQLKDQEIPLKEQWHRSPQSKRHQVQKGGNENTEEIKKGKYVYAARRKGSKELFESAKKLLVNPVNRVIGVRYCEQLNEMPKASDYALSEISMLNPPSIPVYACYKKDPLLVNFEIIEEPEWDESGQMSNLELWDYDPQSLKKNGIVDIISLYCSLRDNKDARVEGELDKALEEYKWLS